MTLHTLVSYFKSGVRIAACLVALLFAPVSSKKAVQILATGLLAAEILGLVEEMPGMYKGTDTKSDS